MLGTPLRLAPFLGLLLAMGCSSSGEPIAPAASYQLTLTDARFTSERPALGPDTPVAGGREMRVDFRVADGAIEARVTAPWRRPARYLGTVGEGVIAFAPA